MKKGHNKNYYNDIALKLSQQLFGLEFLHYGYFQEDVPQNLDSLPAAQKAFCEQVLSHFPEDVKKVLDVGCGAGGMAKALIGKGYEVTCIDPDPFLTSKTSQVTGGKVEVREGFYENIDNLPEHAFDLVMMSESCQYISPTDGWLRHERNLREGGYVLAADFFKIRDLDAPYLSKSGHDLEGYIKEGEKNGFYLLKKIDITPYVAPTMDIYQELINEKIFPVAEAVFEVVYRRFPSVYKMLSYFIKDKVVHLKTKYSHQDSETFSKYKGYYILLFEKRKTHH